MKSLVVYLVGLVLTLMMLRMAQVVQKDTALLKYAKVKEGILSISKSYFFVVMAFIPLWYIIAFRDMSVGRDAYGTQYNIFKHVAYGRFYDFANFGDESGYFLLNKICTIFSDSYHLVLIVTGTLSWLLFYRYIISESCAPSYSVLILFLNFNYFHQFNIMRQFIACGIILCGFKYIYQRDLFKYVIIILLAFSFHKIAIVALSYYFLYDLRINSKRGILLVIASKLGFNFTRMLAAKILAGTRYYKILFDARAYETGYMFLEIAVAAVIFVLAMIIENNYDVKDNRIFNFNLWLLTLSLVVAVNSNMIPIPYRILWYININNVVFLPYLINIIQDKKKMILTKLCFVAMYVGYFLYEWNKGVDGVQRFALWKS